MKENLLDGDLTSGQFRLLEEANSFDLEDFYLDKYPSSGGICMITKNQMIMTDCYIKLDRKSSYGVHRDTVDAIYKAIYGISGPDYDKKRAWQDKILDDGNIVIQLCSRAPTLVWIPEEISQYQWELLSNFSNRINQIVAFNPHHFEENPILFDYYIRKGNSSIAINNIEEILRFVEVKEVKNGKTI